MCAVRSGANPWQEIIVFYALRLACVHVFIRGYNWPGLMEIKAACHGFGPMRAAFVGLIERGRVLCEQVKVSTFMLLKLKICMLEWYLDM